MPPLRLKALAFPLFGDLAADDIAAVRQLLRRRQFKAGAMVFQRGDAADDVYLIVSGLLRISVGSADGRELAFRVVGPGEMVGEIGVLDGSRRSADLTALRQSVVLGLGRSALQRLLATRPAIASGVIRFLCHRLRDTSEQLEALALQRIETRLARLLLRLAHAAQPVRDEVELALDLSQGEIATLIGASRPKVNIAFGELEQRGAIRRAGRKLHCRSALLERARRGYRPLTVLLRRGMSPGFVGLAVLLALLAVWGLSRDVVRGTLRERAFDLVVPLLPRPAYSGPGVVIVDIDRDALGAVRHVAMAA